MDNKRMMYTSEDVCMCKKIKKKIDDVIDELYQYAKEEGTTFNDLEKKIFQLCRVFLYEAPPDMALERFIRESLKMRMKNEIDYLHFEKLKKDTELFYKLACETLEKENSK